MSGRKLNRTNNDIPSFVSGKGWPTLVQWLSRAILSCLQVKDGFYIFLMVGGKKSMKNPIS